MEYQREEKVKEKLQPVSCVLYGHSKAYPNCKSNPLTPRAFPKHLSKCGMDATAASVDLTPAYFSGLCSWIQHMRTTSGSLRRSFSPLQPLFPRQFIRTDVVLSLGYISKHISLYPSKRLPRASIPNILRPSTPGPLHTNIPYVGVARAFSVSRYILRYHLQGHQDGSINKGTCH